MPATSFVPTHEAPKDATPAWDHPDASRPPVASLDPGLPVQVVEELPTGWARVVCANGWGAWVDARALVPHRGIGPDPSPDPVPLIGAALAIGATFLPWFTGGAESASAWDVPLRFLLAGTGDPSDVRAGPFLLITSVAALPLLTRRPLPPLLLAALAAVATASASLGASRALVGDQPRPELGVGIVVALLGGFALQFGAVRARSAGRGDMKRDAAGASGLVPAGVVTAIVTAATFAVGSVQQASRDETAPIDPGIDAAANAAFVGPEPPDTNRPCVLAWMAGRGFHYDGADENDEGRGWRSERFYPSPRTAELPRDRASAAGVIAVWSEGLSHLTGLYLQDAARACAVPEATTTTTSGPQPTTATTAVTQPTSTIAGPQLLAIPGTYRLAVQLAEGECPTLRPPTELVVTIEASVLTIRPVGSPTFDARPPSWDNGRLGPDNRFRMETAYGDQEDVIEQANIEGRFVQYPDRVELVSGRLEMRWSNENENCVYTFTGQRG